MAIYCQEHNKSRAHAISHESGNKLVLLQQMNKRTKGKKEKKKPQKTTTKQSIPYPSFSASAMKSKLQI